MSDVKPMRVRRVVTEGGSHIEPPLDSAWSDERKLAWKAAIVSMDSGIEITIRPGKVWIGSRLIRRHCICTSGISSSAYDFGRAWDYLNGMRHAASAILRATE